MRCLISEVFIPFVGRHLVDSSRRSVNDPSFLALEWEKEDGMNASKLERFASVMLSAISEGFYL